jgi:hypothetical protein
VRWVPHGNVDHYFREGSMRWLSASWPTVFEALLQNAIVDLGFSRHKPKKWGSRPCASPARDSATEDY